MLCGPEPGLGLCLSGTAPHCAHPEVVALATSRLTTLIRPASAGLP
jgi:hypothetical protein